MVQAWCCEEALTGFDRTASQIGKKFGRKLQLRCPEERLERFLYGVHKMAWRLVIIPVVRGFNDEESGVAGVPYRRNAEEVNTLVA